jgi:hypothetical protein
MINFRLSYLSITVFIFCEILGSEPKEKIVLKIVMAYLRRDYILIILDIYPDEKIL